MAYAARGYSVTLILLITWLLMKAEIDVCKKGAVTVSPARMVLLGSTINISCSLKPQNGCSHRSDFQKLTLYQNGNRLSSLNRRSLSVRVSSLRLGATLFTCKVSCGSQKEIPVCGSEVFVGITPEQPQNLSCSQLGERGTVVCTWAKGRETHLDTVYTLRLTGPNNLHLENQCTLDHDDLGISLSSDSPEANYTARVVATNSLGNSSSSLPFVFSFMDVVKPLPPSGIRADFPNMAANFCTLQWQDPGPVMLNRLQFRPVNGSSWETVHVTNAGGRYNLYNLKPFTEYEFQIASKFHPIKGRWSDWSELWRTWTPEEEPVGTLDVWYTLDDVEGGLQSISLFWKNMSASEARGSILRYQVVVQEVSGSAEPLTLRNSTVRNHWTAKLPRKDYATAVSAVNSKGCSPPTRTFIPRQPREAPRNVFAESQGADGIRVTWEPPGHAAAPVQEYLLEWRELGRPPSPVHWLRLPPVNTSAVIAGHLRPRACHQIRLCALAADGAGCARARAPTAGTEPPSSPRVRGAAWPAEEPPGCLPDYRAGPQELHAKNGSQSFDAPDWNILVVPIVAALIVVGIFSAPGMRAKVTAVLSSLQPQWCGQEIPDPANSMWAKKYSVVQGDVQFHLDNLSSSCFTGSEEPETLEIKEVLHKAAMTLWETHPVRGPRHPDFLKTESQHPLPAVGAERGGPPPMTPGPCQAERGEGVAPCQAMDSGGAEARPPKAGGPGSLRSGIPVCSVPASVDYLPSHLDYMPSVAAEPPEDGELQGLSFSIFPKGSFQPLICGDKLTLDRVKIDSGALPH
ncbi:interleukin-12 receptor subunit beta-2 [Monodelphis domestica]|uniref:interleukin-12 receptor subunit beta-2 n=1 Tax=Monodelphis domestica TaxID=13616 RepID=UPI0024E20749|nr:interleukin-12 receptor subunit beta-2 [Monodelphis domestica]